MAAHRADAQQRDLHMVDFGLTACAAVLKTGRLVLGPKNVHQPWPLALYVGKVLSRVFGQHVRYPPFLESHTSLVPKPGK